MLKSSYPCINVNKPLELYLKATRENTLSHGKIGNVEVTVSMLNNDISFKRGDEIVSYTDGYCEYETKYSLDLVVPECEGKNTDTGILATKIYADGSQYDKLCSDSGVSFNQKSGFIHMDGKEVFKVAVPSLVQGVEETLAIANVDINDVDWYIPHQANLRIIDSVAKKLELDESKVIVTVDHHGNTSAASIPLALAESIESGKVKKGDLVAFSSMGAGFTWGGMVIRI